ncbi:MAG: LemA family protein [Solirubrobacterales bacterium]
MIAAIVLVTVLVVLAFAVVLVRNSLIGMRNRCDEAWSGIDVQLKRRHDLVPNLVETVKGYAQHERATFERVTEARAEAIRARGPGEAGRAEGALTGALAELRAIAEGYPELRATENFQQLSRNLSELEAAIQAARRSYNADVQSYNTRMQVFPNSIVARLGGFSGREFFGIEDARERQAARVSFS